MSNVKPPDSANKHIFLYAISALSLLALASIYPKLAIWLVVLLIAGVVAMNADQYSQLLENIFPQQQQK